MTTKTTDPRGHAPNLEVYEVELIEITAAGSKIITTLTARDMDHAFKQLAYHYPITKYQAINIRRVTNEEI